MSTDVIMLLILLVIMALDIWLYADKLPKNSFSQRIVILSRAHPSIPLFCGFLMGHWFG